VPSEELRNNFPRRVLQSFGQLARATRLDLIRIKFALGSEQKA
jgi:hypothetical protein